MRILIAAVRLVLATIVLMLIGYIVPGFSPLTFGDALVAALVIVAITYLIDVVLGRRGSTYGRGIFGFLASAVVIFVAQVIVPNMHVSVLGALLAALVIGIVNMVVPTAIRQIN